MFASGVRLFWLDSSRGRYSEPPDQKPKKNLLGKKRATVARKTSLGFNKKTCFVSSEVILAAGHVQVYVRSTERPGIRNLTLTLIYLCEFTNKDSYKITLTTRRKYINKYKACFDLPRSVVSTFQLYQLNYLTSSYGLVFYFLKTATKKSPSPAKLVPECSIYKARRQQCCRLLTDWHANTATRAWTSSISTMIIVT